jgi:hypothetical protein
MCCPNRYGLDRAKLRTRIGPFCRGSWGFRHPFERLVKRSVLEKAIVGIAVQPALSGFRGRNHRMPRCPRVLARVPVRRAVAAAGATALLTRSEMNPSRPDLDALFALVALRVPHTRDGAKMNACGIGRRQLPVPRGHGYVRGCGTIRIYGLGDFHPAGYFSLASASETAGTMMTSSPCFQLTGVATLCFAVS